MLKSNPATCRVHCSGELVGSACGVELVRFTCPVHTLLAFEKSYSSRISVKFTMCRLTKFPSSSPNIKPASTGRNDARSSSGRINDTRQGAFSALSPVTAQRSANTESGCLTPGGSAMFSHISHKSAGSYMRPFCQYHD